MKYFVILLILTGIVSAIIPQAFACSCAAEWNIEDDFAENDNIIFSGKVTNIKQQQRTFLVTFEIDQSWKGIPVDIVNINIMTSQSSSSCGYDFAEQHSYLVVAYGKWDQTPNVGICDSTTILDFAHEEISYLNKQAVPITHIKQVNSLVEQLPETPPHDPYTDDERLQLASEKKFLSEETMGGGSGMGFFDAYDFELITVIIAILIGVGSGIGLTFYLRKRK
jgi:hypothetical protein